MLSEYALIIAPILVFVKRRPLFFLRFPKMLAFIKVAKIF